MRMSFDPASGWSANYKASEWSLAAEAARSKRNASTPKSAACVIVSNHPRMMLQAVNIGAVTPSCLFNFYFYDSLNN
jgi:hypothetical protein